MSLINALSKTLFHADWADKYLEKLKSDPTLERDEEIQQLRRVMLAKDYGSDKSAPDRVLLNLLDTNKQNRMAFEYLMATYLLQRQAGLVSFIHNLHRLKDFNYPKIPRLYEEAIIVYMIETNKSVDFHGYQISPESIRRYEEFVQSVQRHDNILQANAEPHGDMIATKLKAVREYTVDNFGDSYMFYYYSDNREQKNEAQLNQDNVFAYTRLADDYRQLKQYDTAIKHALKALEIARDSIDAYYQLSLCYYEKGMFDEPEKHLNKELVEHPRYPKVAAVLAEKLYEKGQIRRAYKKYLHILELDPDSLDGLNSVAWLQAASVIDGIRNPQQAVGYALKACKVTDNRNPEALDTLAVAYAASGDFQKAIETSQKAIEVANSQGDDGLAGRIQKRQNLYRQSKAYLEPQLISSKIP